MREHHYYTYIVASRSLTLYVGVTNCIERRVREHRSGDIPGFASSYKCNRLVWFERYQTVQLAIAREKQIKGWVRRKKVALIEQHNPTWLDLSENWGEPIVLFAATGRDAGPSTPLRSAQDDKVLR